MQVVFGKVIEGLDIVTEIGKLSMETSNFRDSLYVQKTPRPPATNQILMWLSQTLARLVILIYATLYTY